MERFNNLTKSMQDSELKKLLQEACPVLPGQEDRAWAALRDRLYQPGPASGGWSWLYLPSWRGAAIALVVFAVLAFIGNNIVVSYQPISYASADSKSPGIYATSFYSRSAQAQVVWLNGLRPVSDPAAPAHKNQPTGTPDSL